MTNLSADEFDFTAVYKRMMVKFGRKLTQLIICVRRQDTFTTFVISYFGNCLERCTKLA